MRRAAPQLLQNPDALRLTRQHRSRLATSLGTTQAPETFPWRQYRMRIGSWITTRLCLATAALSLFASVSVAPAQTSGQSLPATQNQAPPKAQITAAINPAQRKVLGNSVHPLANSAND